MAETLSFEAAYSIIELKQLRKCRQISNRVRKWKRLRGRQCECRELRKAAGDLNKAEQRVSPSGQKRKGAERRIEEELNSQRVGIAQRESSIVPQFHVHVATAGWRQMSAQEWHFGNPRAVAPCSPILCPRKRALGTVARKSGRRVHVTLAFFSTA
jgi:hypothetical protein